MKRTLLVVLSMLLVLSLLSGCTQNSADDPAAPTTKDSSANAQKYHFKFSITQSSNDPLAKYVKMMMDTITEKTNGNITFDFYPNGELGTINDAMEQIANGAELFAYGGPDAFTSVAPDLAILNCQYFLDSQDQIESINKSDWYKEQVELLASKGNTRILSYNWFTGYRHFISKKPINSVDDFNGLQMRCADSPAMVAFGKALGCSPVVTNWNEVYSALSQNMVDCAEGPLAMLYASSLQEVAKYVALTKHHVSTGVIAMPENIFKSMPKEYQDIILQACWDSGEAFSKYSLECEEEFKQKMTEAGVQFTTPDVKAIRTKASSMYKDPTLGFPDGLYEKVQAISKK